MLVRPLKFLISGGCAAVIEYAAFVLLYTILGSDLMIISQTVSFLAGFLVSFLLNKTWVFESRGRTKGQLLRYSLLASINLILSNIILWVLVDRLGLVYLIAKIIVMTMVAVWNYVLFSRLIFKNNEN